MTNLHSLVNHKIGLERQYGGQVPWDSTGIYTLVDELEKQIQEFESTELYTRSTCTQFMDAMMTSKVDSFKQLSQRINFNGYYKQTVPSTLYTTPTKIK